MSKVTRVVMSTVEYAGNIPKGKCTYGGGIFEEERRDTRLCSPNPICNSILLERAPIRREQALI